MYGDVVMGVQKTKDEDHEPFEVAIHKLKHDRYHADIEDTKMTVKGPQGTGESVQETHRGAHRKGISAGSLEAALGRHRCRVRFLDE